MLNNPSAGFFNSSEYQSAGLPWVYTGTAGSNQILAFPMVTRSVIINNLSTTATDKIDVTFANPTGSAANKFSVMAGQVVDFPLRVKSIWIAASSGTPQFSVCAALTTIPSRDMPPLLSGSWEGV